MELKLNELSYQKDAVKSIVDVFEKNFFLMPRSDYQNPYIDFANENIINKIKSNILVQNNKIANAKLHKEPQVDGECLNIDIKMETGTGKTYVYTKTIYELNKEFGIKKFIIVVPSLAIKQGTKSFIMNSRKYFNNELQYENYLYLYEQKDGEFGKNASKFPKSVSDYFDEKLGEGISVLITNDDYLTETSYGQNCENSIIVDLPNCNNRCPKEVISYTKPFIIIDEPHNFKDGNVVKEFIKTQLKPQCILRFGATFPESDIIIGKGKNKKTEKIIDYKNLVYDLSTKEAFNKNYIKSVSVYNTDEIDSAIKNIKFTDFKKGEGLIVKYKNENSIEQTRTLQVGDNLSFLGEDYSNLILKNVSSSIAYINDIRVNKYEKKLENDYNASDFSESFQEGMIMTGLIKHFKKEKQNLNKDHLIKTICLFFISDIDLYRDRNSGKDTDLKNVFEKCLKTQIKEELKHINRNNKYELLFEKYLNATLENIDRNDDNRYKVHGGYFAGEADNKEDSEYDRIIKNKSKTLNLINENGYIEIDENGDIILTREDGTKSKNVTFNTFRFIFSKWTLKEGWDNPNVFTIVKLRTSKSHNRKMQELGRGLRIPVDIYMNRLNDGKFDLNYIIDNKEKDFAESIIKEIYGDEGVKIGEQISDSILNKIAQKLNISNDDAFAKLITDRIIDRNGIINNIDELLKKYGDCIENKLKESAIRQNPKNINETVKIRKENFEKIKDLWLLLNNRYYISINNNTFTEKECDKFVYDALNSIEESDCKNVINVNRTYNTKETESNNLVVDHFYVDYEKMKYNDFLIVISEKTFIPITILHKVICEYVADVSIDSKKINESFFNRNVCNKMIRVINEKKFENLTEKFKYTKLDYGLKETKLTDEQGNVLDEIQANLVGVMGEGKVQSEKYLYDTIRYDSDIEKNYINDNSNKEVIVYGKIPRRSIRIPKIDGGTTSPDFMYVIKENDNCKSINLVIETKGFDKQSDGSINEERDKKYQEKFFEQFKNDLKKDGINFEYKYHLNNDELSKVIDDLIKNNNVK